MPLRQDMTRRMRVFRWYLQRRDFDCCDRENRFACQPFRHIQDTPLQVQPHFRDTMSRSCPQDKLHQHRTHKAL